MNLFSKERFDDGTLMPIQYTYLKYVTIGFAVVAIAHVIRAVIVYLN